MTITIRQAYSDTKTSLLHDSQSHPKLLNHSLMHDTTAYIHTWMLKLVQVYNVSWVSVLSITQTVWVQVHITNGTFQRQWAIVCHIVTLATPVKPSIYDHTCTFIGATDIIAYFRLLVVLFLQHSSHLTVLVQALYNSQHVTREAYTTDIHLCI